MSIPSITTERIGPAAVVAVSGDVTFGNAAWLARDLHAALDEGPTRLVVDLTDVGFMDSAGLAALLRAAATARRSDTSMALVHAPEAPPNILRFKGVDQLMRMYQSRDDALS